MSKKKILLLAAFSAILLSPSSSSRSAAVEKSPFELQALDHGDVMQPLPAGKIHLHGYLDKCIRLNQNKWLKKLLPWHDLVDLYRTPRKRSAIGEMWGKAMLGSALVYRYTGDEKLKAMLVATTADLLTTVRPNGSIACDPPEQQPNKDGGDVWERKYIMLGLMAYYTYVDASPRVLQTIEGVAHSVISQVGPSPRRDILSLGWSPNGIESASILEAMMRLYELTGKKQYLDYAEYILSTGGAKGYNIFAQILAGERPRNIAKGFPKAYEMTSVMNGVAEYYRVTHLEKWKRCISSYFDLIKKYELTIVGNGGGDQPYYPEWIGEAWDDTRLEQANPRMARMMETCIGAAWTRFCSYILRTGGDASAAECIERYALNCMTGAMQPDGGGFSYVNMLNGQKVTNVGWGWNFNGLPVTCCNLNGPTALAYIPYTAVMQTGRGPVVNLYEKLTAEVKTPRGRDVKLSMDTRFPLDGNVNITLDESPRELYDITLRIPSWSEGTKVEVNGKPVSGFREGEYFPISRKWRKGDRISLTLGIRCRLVKAPVGGSNPEALNRVALMYGPVVLSRDENIDPKFDQPVSIIHDVRGYVDAKPVKPTLQGTLMEFEIPTRAGSIRMTDYASVDGWKGKRICTWMVAR